MFGSNRGFGAVFSCWIRELEKRGVPCCVVGVSGDRNVSRFQIPRNKKALQKCFLGNVRDEESRNVFSELYGISADYSPDVVFLLGRKNEVGANQTTTLCIPVHLQNKFLNGETDTEYYYHLIQGNSRKDGDQVVFSTTESKDQNYVQDLCFAINQKYGTEYTFIPCSNYEKYCEILERTRIVISGRMHAMILGLLYGCEIKPIAFKSKLEVFEKEYGNNADINHICENVRCSYKKIAETIEKQCS